MKDGDLWRPASYKQDIAFQEKWCVHCLELAESETWEDEFGDEIKSCGILDAAFYKENAHQLKWRNGEPVCTAFRNDPDNPMRCPFTKEMFR